jgi:hypothetical protein
MQRLDGHIATTAADDEEVRRLAVLLLDEPGCGGAPLRFHKGRTDARPDRMPTDARSSSN